MNELNILAKFDYDGKTYLITLINKKIVFYTYSNDLFSKELSNAELEMCMDILDSITIRKETSIYLRNKRIGNNVYQIFYDTTTRLHWWKCITSKEINEEDNRVLMILYNYSSAIYYFSLKSENNTKKSSIIRTIKGKIFRIIILPMVWGAFIGSVSSSYTGIKLSEQRMIEYLDDEQISKLRDYRKFKKHDNYTDYNNEAKSQRNEINGEVDYDWNQINQAIEENQYLSQDEKDFVKKLKYIFDKDHNYMNIPMIIENLKTLRFTYFENEIPFDKNSSGAHIAYLNHIYFANAQSIKDIDEMVKIHELIHMVAISSSGYSSEYITELATKEYLLKLIELGEIQPKTEWYDSNGRIINNIKFWIFARL